MNENKKKPNQVHKNESMDHPEQYATEKESLFDRFESEKNVDPIPMEDLKENLIDEKNKHHTKNISSSEKKYNSGM